MARNIFKQFFDISDDETDSSEQVTSESQDGPAETDFNQNQRKNTYNRKIVPIATAPAKTSKIVLFEPRIYSDAKEIGTHLLNGRAVIVNFGRLDHAAAGRIVDFLTGTVFAINGEIKRVGDQIFLCTPANFETDGSLSDILSHEQAQE